MLFYLIYLELGFLSVPGLEVVNLARLVISFQCKVSVRSPYLVSFLFLCWITKWSHNPPTYRRTVSSNWYCTHTVLRFGHQRSWITGACHYTRRIQVHATALLAGWPAPGKAWKNYHLKKPFLHYLLFMFAAEI